MDHLDDLAIPEGGEIGGQRRLSSILRRRAHDHDDLVSCAHEINEFAKALTATCAAHEREGLLAVLTRADSGRVASMPLDVTVKQLADGIEITMERSLKTTARQLYVPLAHAAYCRSAQRPRGRKSGARGALNPNMTARERPTGVTADVRCLCMPSIQPELWVDRAGAAVEFYKAAFGAVVLHSVGRGDDIVVQLAVGEAVFWLAAASPEIQRFSPNAIGGTTGRSLLVVDDPTEVLEQAVRAGAREIAAIGNDHGWRLGRIVDPFGHEWEIGRPLGDWPPVRLGAS